MILGMYMYRRHSAQAGLSLIEMAVLLVVIGLLAVAAGRVYTVQATFTKEQVTAYRLQKIKEAILAHASAYKRLPCPASRTAKIDSDDFGYEFNLDKDYFVKTFSEAGTGVSSDRCPFEEPMLAPPALTTDDTARVDQADPNAEAGMENSFPVRIGAVPTRTLGLPDEMMFDGWGNRIVYAVSEAFVAPDKYDAEKYPEIVYANTFYGRKRGLTIKDAYDHTIENASVPWLIMSPGADKRGAYNRKGERAVMCSNTGLAHENCNDDDVFVTSFHKNYHSTSDAFTSTLVYDVH